MIWDLSEDGGLDDVEESLPACRSSCFTRAASCSFRARARRSAGRPRPAAPQAPPPEGPAAPPHRAYQAQRFGLTAIPVEHGNWGEQLDRTHPRRSRRLSFDRMPGLLPRPPDRCRVFAGEVQQSRVARSVWVPLHHRGRGSKRLGASHGARRVCPGRGDQCAPRRTLEPVLLAPEPPAQCPRN